MVRDGILDDLEKFLLRVDGTNGQSVKKLDHETRKSLECTWNTDGGADFDEDSFGGVNIDLQTTSFVDGRVQKCKQALERVSDASDVESRLSGPDE